MAREIPKEKACLIYLLCKPRSIGQFQENNNKVIVLGYEQKELMDVWESCMQIKLL